MKPDVVHEEGLRVVEIGEHAGDLFGHRREAVGETALRRQAGCPHLEDLARFEDLVAREAVQCGEKAERTGAEPRRTAGDERPGALARFGHAHGGEGMETRTNRRPAHAQLLGQLPLGHEAVAGTELFPLDQQGDVPHHLIHRLDIADVDFLALFFHLRSS